MSWAEDSTRPTRLASSIQQQRLLQFVHSARIGLGRAQPSAKCPLGRANNADASRGPNFHLWDRFGPCQIDSTRAKLCPRYPGTAQWVQALLSGSHDQSRAHERVSKPI